MREAAAERNIPSVHRLAEALGDIDLPRPIIVNWIQARLERYRHQLASDPLAAAIEPQQWISALRGELTQARLGRICPVVNATGVIIHTNLGRAPLSRRAARALVEGARNYTNVEYDLAGGQRGQRAEYLERSLAILFNAESATVVNNCAAALALMVHHFTSTSPGKEVVISRGELVQIGGGFRVHEILQASGAVLCEVGSTNKTTAEDYRAALNSKTAALLRVHRSNFYMSGFVESPTTAELSAIARHACVPLIEDLGSGATFDTELLGGKEREPIPAEALAHGADLVCVSGDKLLGGPQAGIILGGARHVAALKRDPLFRAMRCDKLVLAALQATVDALLEGSAGELPIRAMAAVSLDDLSARADRIVQALRAAGMIAGIGHGESRIGGGTLPRTTIPSITVDIRCGDAMACAARLRKGKPPVIGYIADGLLKLDLRTVFPRQDHALIAALRRAADPS